MRTKSIHLSDGAPSPDDLILRCPGNGVRPERTNPTRALERHEQTRTFMEQVFNCANDYKKGVSRSELRAKYGSIVFRTFAWERYGKRVL